MAGFSFDDENPFESDFFSDFVLFVERGIQDLVDHLGELLPSIQREKFGLSQFALPVDDQFRFLEITSSTLDSEDKASFDSKFFPLLHRITSSDIHILFGAFRDSIDDKEDGVQVVHNHIKNRTTNLAEFRSHFTVELLAVVAKVAILAIVIGTKIPSVEKPNDLLKLIQNMEPPLTLVGGFMMSHFNKVFFT